MLNRLIMALIGGFLFTTDVNADSGYNIVQMSTAAPTGTEDAFLAALEAQFIAGVTANPLASNTYSIKLYGPNPTYQAPAPPPTTLEQALSLGATVYVYGFADGQAYERKHDLDTVGHYDFNCSSPTFFGLVTIDTTTCFTIMGQLANDIYTQNFSTPTVIPPPTGN